MNEIAEFLESLERPQLYSMVLQLYEKVRRARKAQQKINGLLLEREQLKKRISDLEIADLENQ